MQTQTQAVALGSIGTFLASPVPKNIMAALSPGRGQKADNVYATSSGKFWLIANDVFMPIVQIVGIGLVAWAVAALVIKGHKAGFRRPIKPIAANHGIAIALAVGTAALTIINPPDIEWPTSEVSNTLKHVAEGATGATIHQGATEPPATTSAFAQGNSADTQNTTSAFK